MKNRNEDKKENGNSRKINTENKIKKYIILMKMSEK